MTLEYQLRINNQLEPLQSLSLLTHHLPILKWNNDELYAPGIVISALSNALGVDIWFWLDSNNDYEEGKRTLLLSVDLLLRNIKGDALFLFNGETRNFVTRRLGEETIIVERKGERLIVNEEQTLISKEQLSVLLEKV